MKFRILAGWLFLWTAAFCVYGQQNESPTEQAKAGKKSSKRDRNANSTVQPYVRPDAAERRKDYFKSIFGPYALARTVAGAGFSTARNSPEEWGGTWEGFGRRVASGFGRNAIRQTMTYALDEGFKLDSRFYRSQKRDFGSKVKNALLSPLTARDKNGKKVFGFPRLVGTYASSIIAAETWYPDRFNYKSGLRSGTVSLGFSAAFNLFREFVKK